jgi:glycosyltransferase involved in cell wall biosynthesis
MVVASFPSVLRTNPYQRLLYEQLAAHGYRLAAEPDFKVGWLWARRRAVGLLHFHWPQAYWLHERGPSWARHPLCYVKLGLFALRLAAARLLGFRVIWTVHQVYPHERARGRLDRVGALVLARFSHVLIAHDRGTQATVARELGRQARKLEIVPHGSYVGVYPPGRPRDAVRRELGVAPDSFLFLCFGDLRAYKDVDLLLSAFRSTVLADAALLVTGTVGSEGRAERVRTAARDDPRIRARLGFVPEDQVAELFSACDAAVVARGDGGTSGALILALSLGLPAVAARRAAYEDLLDGEAAGWLFEPGDADSLRRALERAAATDEEKLAAKRTAALTRASLFRWDEIGRTTARLLAGGAA